MSQYERQNLSGIMVDTHRIHETMSSRRKNLGRSRLASNLQEDNRSDVPIEAWIRRQVGSRQACTGHISVKLLAGIRIVNTTDRLATNESNMRARSSGLMEAVAKCGC